MRARPVHAGAFEASFDHQLVGALHDPTANRPALRLEGRILQLAGALILQRGRGLAGTGRPLSPEGADHLLHRLTRHGVSPLVGTSTTTPGWPETLISKPPVYCPKCMGKSEQERVRQV